MARFLFRLMLMIALLLMAAVQLAPFADVEAHHQRLITLFARDGTVRRTALASAFGIIVTACVFFRPPPAPSEIPNEPR